MGRRQHECPTHHKANREFGVVLGRRPREREKKPTGTGWREQRRAAKPHQEQTGTSYQSKGCKLNHWRLSMCRQPFAEAGADLPAIPGMLSGQAFVATFVVSREAGHGLLRLRERAALEFGEQIGCGHAAQGRGQATAVQDLHGTVAASAVGEAEIGWVMGGHRSASGHHRRASRLLACSAGMQAVNATAIAFTRVTGNPRRAWKARNKAWGL